MAYDAAAEQRVATLGEWPWQRVLEAADAAAINAARAEIAKLREQLQVVHDIEGTVWEALKPLNLQAIDVANPGRHVTDVIDRAARYKAALAQLARPPLPRMNPCWCWCDTDNAIVIGDEGQIEHAALCKDIAAALAEEKS